jgi:4-amino-4-deoxy-L-arabinose transferase-like glycosyltransferase
MLLAVFVLAFVARVSWIETLGPDLTWDDEREFAAIARSIAHGDGYVGDSFRANPVMPFYLATSFRLFGERYDVPRLGQALVGAATCVLLAEVGALVAPAVATVAGVLLAVYPAHVYLAGVFYVDCIQTFLCTWLLLVVLRGAERGRPLGRGLAAGVLLGLAVLTRPIVMAYLPCLCAFWLFATRRPWRARAGICAACILGMTFVMAPWTIRNARAYHRLVPVSSGFFTKLWQGNNELADGGPDDRDLLVGTPDWQARLARVPEPGRAALEAKYAPVPAAIDRRARAIGDVGLARDDVLGPIALRLLADEPGRMLVLAGRKLVTLFSAFSDTESQNEDTTPFNRGVAASAFYPVLVLALAGAWVGRAHARGLLPVHLFIGAIVGAYALLNACTRFRLPLDPYLILLAAIALTHAGGRWRPAA